MKTLHLSIIVILATSLVIVGNNVFADNTTTAHGGLVGFHQAYFKSDHGNYPIWYKITNGTVINTPLDLPAKELLFEINTTSDGQLTVELPRTIIDSKNGSKDVPYFVSIYDIRSLGGPMRVLPEELSDKDLRILQINFTRDTSEIGISGTYFVENYPFIPQKLESPLKQFKSGISLENITCKEGLVKIMKLGDSSTACVTPVTFKILIQRGWGTAILSIGNPGGRGFPFLPFNNNVTSSPKILQNGTLASNATSSIQLPLGISTPTISSTKSGIKIISIEMSPDPLKVGDIPQFKVTYQNISDQTFYINGGCRATTLFASIIPSNHVVEKSGPLLMCSDWQKPIKPNQTFTTIAHSKFINGYYQITKAGMLNVTLDQFITDQKTGWKLVETIQFNINAIQKETNNSFSKQVYENSTRSITNVTKVVTTSSNNTRYPIGPSPVYSTPRVGTINVSTLPPISKVGPWSPNSITPLATISETPIIHYSNPNVTKILDVGMSPNPLKVGDIARFTVTYQNILGKPIYGITGCGSDLSASILPSSNVQLFYNGLTCAQFGDIIQPNQTVTDGTFFGYKIIQPGLLNVTLNLDLNEDSEDYSHPIIDTIQFNVNATQ